MVENLSDLDKVKKAYVDLAEDICTRENQLREELPTESTAEIDSHLRGTVNDWETGRKSVRTIPVSEVYTQELDRPLEESLKQLLVGLDATVNVLDDIIDTRGLSPQARIGLTVNVAFSAVLVAESCPPNARDEVGDQLREYFTALFQIPLVEQRLYSSMKNAEDEDQRYQAAKQIYAYRSRDIDGFTDIAATVTELNTESRQRVQHDLRTYRARRLLFKDIHDVERDLRDDDTTPVIQLLQYYETTEDVSNAITEIYSHFSYSEGENKRYVDRLYELENKPTNLNSLLSEAKKRVNAINSD